ncbi:MAG: hypothetical protein ACNA8H_05670 [Anaerolineales bacterium]
MKLIFITVLLFSWLPLGAQEEAKEVKRTCRILFLNKPADAPNEAYLFDGETSHKVLLPSMNFSQLVELPSGPTEGGMFTIGLSPIEVKSVEEFPPGAPKVTLPNTSTDIYLLLASDPDNKVLPVKIQPLNVDDAELKQGETLWINLTRHNVAARLGEERLFIPPMKQTVSPPPLKESGYYRVQFIYQADGQGEFLPIMRKSWWFDATSKNLGFIINSDARLPKIFTFRDRRQPSIKNSGKKASDQNEI